MNADEMKQYITPDLDPRKNADHLFLYKGLNCRQTRRVLDSLDELKQALANEPPATIIEIGTFFGAFTQVLRDHDISAVAEIHTFDIKDFSKARVEGTTYHFGDVFRGEHPTIVSLIRRAGRCIVMCDGGDKEHEVRTFCSYLKPGDLIMCHDYAMSPEVMLNKDIVGNWPSDQHESHWAQIKDALTAASCVPFMELTMQRAMWGCFVRT